MVFVYILDCVLTLLFSLGGPCDMATTQRAPTVIDTLIGIITLIVLEIVVFGTAVLVRYLKNRKILKLKQQMQKNRNVKCDKKTIYNSNDKKIILISMLISVLVFIIGIIVSVIVSNEIGRTVGIYFMLFGGLGIYVPNIMPITRFLWNKFRITSYDVDQIMQWQKEKEQRGNHGNTF